MLEFGIDDSSPVTAMMLRVHDAEELLGENFPYLPTSCAVAVHVAWCTRCASLLDDATSDTQAASSAEDRVAAEQITSERIAKAQRAAQAEYISFDAGTCRNNHDTSVGGRYRDTGKCVTCVSEQGRRQWQKRKRKPLYESAYQFFMTPDERKRHKAFCALAPDWWLPRNPQLLADELRAVTPAHLSESDKLDVIAELIVMVVSQGYITNRKLLKDSAARYARTLPNRYTISTDDILPGTDGAIRLIDTLTADAPHF